MTSYSSKSDGSAKEKLATTCSIPANCLQYGSSLKHGTGFKKKYVSRDHNTGTKFMLIDPQREYYQRIIITGK